MLDLYTNIIYSKAQLLNNSTKTHKFQEKQPFFFFIDIYHKTKQYIL